MSDTQIGYGTQFLMAATPAATALTVLAEVTSVSPPNEQAAEVEVTNYGSPNRTREYIAGLTDPGTISVEMNWVPGSPSDTLLKTAKADSAVRIMRIVTPDSDTQQQFTFPGFVQGYERNSPVDDRMTATVTIRVAGAVTQVAAFDDPTEIVETP